MKNFIITVGIIILMSMLNLFQFECLKIMR